MIIAKDKKQCILNVIICMFSDGIKKVVPVISVYVIGHMIGAMFTGFDVTDEC